MMHVIKPDFQIHIGVKDGKVMQSNWGEMLPFHPEAGNIEIKGILIAYLRQAIKHVEGVPKV